MRRSALLFAALAAAPSAWGQTPPGPASTPALSLPGPVPVRLYGILWTSVTASTAVESFANANATAPTAAANPETFPDDEVYLSFQVQQTRVGLQVGEGTPVRGQLEVDFIHFDLSSPTTQAFPRVRVATVAWYPTPAHRLFLGQDWDVFSPLNTHGVNLVGNYFSAGNAGFMRHQLGWVGAFGRLEVALAAGLAGSNAGPSFANLETDAIPTGALRVAWRSPRVWAGASFVGTAVRVGAANASERRAAFGANAFAELTLGALNLRAEAYYGMNLGSLGALTLGVARVGQSVAELGGWLSARYTAGMHQAWAGAGAASVLDPSEVLPGYSLNARTPAAGLGITANLTAHAGYAVSPWRGLTLALEGFAYRTTHRLAAGATHDPARTAAGATLAAMYAF